MKMFTSHYDGQSGIREHIMSMCDMAAKLKTLEMSIFEGFLVHFITSCSVRPFHDQLQHIERDLEHCRAHKLLC
jgi:hypothetical protein